MIDRRLMACGVDDVILSSLFTVWWSCAIGNCEGINVIVYVCWFFMIMECA